MLITRRAVGGLRRERRLRLGHINGNRNAVLDTRTCALALVGTTICCVTADRSRRELVLYTIVLFIFTLSGITALACAAVEDRHHASAAM